MLSIWLNRFKKFRVFIGPEVWHLFLIALVLGVIWFLIETSFVYILQAFFSSFGIMRLNTQIDNILPTDPTYMSLILIVYGFARGSSFMLRNYFSGVANQAFIRHQKFSILRMALMSQYQFTTFEITTAFNESVNSAGIVLQNLNMLVCNGVSILLFVIYGAHLAPIELLLGFVLMFIILLPTQFLDKRVKLLGEAMQKGREIVNKTLNLGIRNNFFLRLYGLIPQEIERGRVALDDTKKHFQVFSFLASTRSAFPLAAGVTVISIISLISFKFLKTDGFKLMAFFYIFIRLAQSLSDAYSVWNDMRLQLPAFKSLYQWNLKSQEIEKNIQILSQKNENKKVSASLASGRIRIQADLLTFMYGNRAIIKDLSFDVKEGQILVIHGESGAGKTTLLSLLVGTLPPSSGQILINGHPSAEITDILGTDIGYAGPDPYLIPGTVRENLFYGMSDHRAQKVTDESLWESLRFAEIEPTVRNLKSGLDEYINEWAQLSTGQRQRLAIARAVLRKPKLIIFDEATANLDERTEKNIVHFLKQWDHRPTIVIVSHKTSFDSIADQMLTLTTIRD